MYLAIARDGVRLREPEVVTDLYASYTGRLTAGRLNALLAEHDAGAVESNGAYVAIPVATLRRMAAGRVPEGWDTGFDDLLERARDRGQLSDDRATIRTTLEHEA